LPGVATSRLVVRLQPAPADQPQISRVCSDDDGAATTIGGLFLQRFVGDCSWAHLDIAGPACFSPDQAIATSPRGHRLRRPHHPRLAPTPHPLTLLGEACRTRS
ncbi:MAG: hypothetical protein ACRD0K_28955, partial [Egibacteraceae bacterium]